MLDRPTRPDPHQVFAGDPLTGRDLLPFYLRGAQINAALYLAGCIAAGLLTYNQRATLWAIAAAGSAYLNYVCYALGWPQPGRWTTTGHCFAVVSLILAAAAGIALF